MTRRIWALKVRGEVPQRQKISGESERFVCDGPWRKVLKNFAMYTVKKHSICGVRAHSRHHGR